MKNALAALLVAVILSVSGIWVANILSDTAVSIKNKGYVTVKGYARQAIKSDLGVLRATLVAEHADLKTCYQILTQDKAKTGEFLKRFGIGENSIVSAPAAIFEKYKVNENGYATDEFVNYKLSQDLRIESPDVDKVAQLSEQISALLDEGVKMFVSYPEYYFTGIEDLKIEMIGRATANAKERAEKIASEGKFKLGPIASVRVGVFQITPANSTDVSDYGINDTTSIDKEVKSTVEIQYFVK